MKQLLVVVLLLAVFVMVGLDTAQAAFSMPVGLTEMDMSPVEAWLGLAVVAYAALFGYRKFIKTGNRS